MVRRALVGALVGALIAGSAVSRTAAQSSPSRRLVPVADRDLTPQQRALVASYVRGGVLTNDIRTLLRHPGSLPGVMPFWNYIAFESTLPPRDRTILILRTAWLSNSRYLWAKYAGASDLLTANDLLRLASFGSGDRPSFDETLLDTADALQRTAFVPDRTWSALTSRYGTEQLMDAVFTVAETTMLAGLVNSLGVPIDNGFTLRPPREPVSGNFVRTHPALSVPRIPPLEQTFWTGELRALLDPDATGRDIAAVYRTFAQHPALYRPRQQLSEYIRLESTLTDRVRELAILRIGYLCGSDYEWAAHVRAGRAAGLSDAEIGRIATPSRTGWNAADGAIVGAVDELFASDTISDAAWSRLVAVLDQRQVIDFLITTGGYRMVSMALNTLGVPMEAGSERIPR